jgi:hypothetical protein
VPSFVTGNDVCVLRCVTIHLRGGSSDFIPFDGQGCASDFRPWYSSQTGERSIEDDRKDKDGKRYVFTFGG